MSDDWGSQVDSTPKKKSDEWGSGGGSNSDSWGDSWGTAGADTSSEKPRGGGGGGGGRSCFKCGKEGHLSRECPSGGSGRRGGGSSGGRGCFKCGEEGHMSRECPSGGGSGNRGSSGGRGCFKCGEEGHMSRECPSGGGGGSRGGGGRSCYKCGEEGHISRDCTSGGGGGGRSSGFGGSDSSAQKRSNPAPGGSSSAKKDDDWGSSVSWGEDPPPTKKKSSGDDWGSGGGGSNVGSATGSRRTSSASPQKKSGDDWGTGSSWGEPSTSSAPKKSSGGDDWGTGSSWGEPSTSSAPKKSSGGDDWGTGSSWGEPSTSSAPKKSSGGDDWGASTSWGEPSTSSAPKKAESSGNDWGSGGGSGPSWGESSSAKKSGDDSWGKNDSFGGSKSSGGGKPQGKGCFKCGQEGHMSRECPSGGGASGSKGCFKCGQEGHMSRECPSGGGASGSKGCFKCKGEGHIAKDCTEPSLDADGKPRPPIYRPPELDKKELFEPTEMGVNFDAYDDMACTVSGVLVPSSPPLYENFKDAFTSETILEGLEASKISKPTPIQKYGMRIVMAGRDLMACAQTGSGKTLAFVLPMLQDLFSDPKTCSEYGKMPQEPKAVIVSPTRELALQIYREAYKYSSESIVKVQIIYGGTSTAHQRAKLSEGCHILIGTPGRLIDFLNRGFYNFAQLKYFVLDEADRMIDAGFIPDIRRMASHPTMPDKTKRQTLMFSATFPDHVQTVAAEFLKNDYLFLTVGSLGVANADIEQRVLKIEKFNKRAKLIELLKLHKQDERVMIFVQEKKTADFLAGFLSQSNFRSTSIHGDRYQHQREEALRDLRSGKYPFIVATSVAARGLDIQKIVHVINYDLPKDIDDYVHRIGRTGRLGNAGLATSFYDPAVDQGIAKDLVKMIRSAEQEVPDWLEDEVKGDGQAFEGADFGGVDIRDGVYVDIDAPKDAGAAVSWDDPVPGPSKEPKVEKTEIKEVQNSAGWDDDPWSSEPTQDKVPEEKVKDIPNAVKIETSLEDRTLETVKPDDKKTEQGDTWGDTDNWNEGKTEPDTEVKDEDKVATIDALRDEEKMETSPMVRSPTEMDTQSEEPEVGVSKGNIVDELTSTAPMEEVKGTEQEIDEKNSVTESAAHSSEVEQESNIQCQAVPVIVQSEAIESATVPESQDENVEKLDDQSEIEDPTPPKENSQDSLVEK